MKNIVASALNTNGAADVNSVSLHLDLTAMSPTGGVFHNLPTRTIVLRYQAAGNIVAMLELAELALKEAQAVHGEILVCDLRALGPAANSLSCAAVLLHLLRSDSVNCLALLTRERDYHPLTAEVQDAITVADTQWCFEQSFEAAVLWFADRSEEMRLWLEARPKDFFASYSGSTYSIPELKCTVLRTSGNAHEYLLSSQLLAQAYATHTSIQGDSFLFDTNASPPLLDFERYNFAYKNIIMPVCTSGSVKSLMHVRSGDKLMAGKVPPLEPLLQSFNIQLFEVETMGEALKILKSLRGHKPT
jgi:hypothetical protein